MRTTALFLAPFVVAAFAAACGGSQPPPAPPAPPEPPAAPTAPAVEDAAAPPAAPAAETDAGATSAAAPAQPAGKPFDDMTKEEKLQQMKTVVAPKMGEVFKAFDAKKYANFGCKTCHGPKGKQDPHDVLPKLTLSNGGMEKLAKKKPAITKFMNEKVEPAMAAALNEPVYDPATHKGFGCGGCHKVD